MMPRVGWGLVQCVIPRVLRGVVTAAAVAASFGTAAGAHAQTTNADRLAGVEALGWAVGSPDAPVTVVEFTDVSCPYCASFHAGTRAELRKEFVESDQVHWITLSYVSGLYPNSGTLSLAAECAGQQGRFEPFMEVAYRERDSWLHADTPEISAAIDRFAAATDLDVVVFATCLLETVPARRIEEIRTLARSLGVRGTPTWFVDGFLVMGDLPFAYARQFIATRLPG